LLLLDDYHRIENRELHVAVELLGNMHRPVSSDSMTRRSAAAFAMAQNRMMEVRIICATLDETATFAPGTRWRCRKR
jgi:ATP/maltotriose-dependent transcriptional regulator MalT